MEYYNSTYTGDQFNDVANTVDTYNNSGGILIREPRDSFYLFNTNQAEIGSTDSLRFTPSTDTRTFGVWVKLSDVNFSTILLKGIYFSGVEYRYRVYVLAERVFWQVNNVTFSSGERIHPHRWYFFALVANGASSKLFINGAVHDQQSLSAQSSISGYLTTLTIGGRQEIGLGGLFVTGEAYSDAQIARIAQDNTYYRRTSLYSNMIFDIDIKKSNVTSLYTNAQEPIYSIYQGPQNFAESIYKRGKQILSNIQNASVSTSSTIGDRLRVPNNCEVQQIVVRNRGTTTLTNFALSGGWFYDKDPDTIFNTQQITQAVTIAPNESKALIIENPVPFFDKKYRITHKNMLGSAINIDVFVTMFQYN